MALRRRSLAARTGDSRLLSAPFEFAVALLFMITATSFVKQLLELPANYPHVGLLSYPMWLDWAWAFSIGTGGLFIFLGVIFVGPYLRLGRGLEKAGLWMSSTAWFTVALADAASNPHQPLEWLTYIAICLGCALRLYALHRLEHALAVATATCSVVTDNETDLD